MHQILNPEHSRTEDISYSGTAGDYLWQVYSFSGSGTYTFGMQRP